MVNDDSPVKTTKDITSVPESVHSKKKKTIRSDNTLSMIVSKLKCLIRIRDLIELSVIVIIVGIKNRTRKCLRLSHRLIFK